MTKLNFDIDLNNGDDNIIPVESSNIKGIGYDEKTKILTVVFKKNTKYRYSDVPKTIYEELMAAESIGKFFHSRIKSIFKYIKD